MTTDKRMLQPYDIVVINKDYDDAEVAGKRGHIIGMVEGDDIAVFVYDIERVWCMKASDVTATGARDEFAANFRGTPIRVSSTGDVLD
jgi:hypothetical protein